MCGNNSCGNDSCWWIILFIIVIWVCCSGNGICGLFGGGHDCDGCGPCGDPCGCR